MSNSEDETSDDLGIDDDQLPEDLQPTDDNPLAQGLEDGETVDDLLDGGKTAEESDEDESDDPDTESDSGES
jgi:hypothetical protein